MTAREDLLRRLYAPFNARDVDSGRRGAGGAIAVDVEEPQPAAS
jgi:hypothetical protein